MSLEKHEVFNKITGWHFSITIKAETKEEAQKLMREEEVLNALIDNAVPSWVEYGEEVGIDKNGR